MKSDSKRSALSKGGSSRSVGSKASTKKSMGSAILPSSVNESEGIGAVGSSERRMLQLRTAVLAVFEEMGSQHRSISISAFLILHFIGFLQLLILPLSPSPNLPWRHAGVQVSGVNNIIVIIQSFLLNVSLVPWVDGFRKLPGFPEFTSWLICTLIAFSCIILFIWSLSRSLRGLPKNKNSVRVILLCNITYIATIALPVPIIANLFGPILCIPLSDTGQADLLWNTYKCWSSSHFGIFITSLITLIFASTYFLLATLLFQIRSPDAKNHPTSIVNGRIDCVAFSVKFILAAIYACGFSINSWVHTAVNLIGSFVLVASYIRFLPHSNPRLNMYITTLYAGVFASASACFIALVVSFGSGPSFATAAGGIIWVFIFPFFCFLGWTLTETRWRLIGKSTDMTDLHVIELRLRWLIAEGLRLQKSAAITNRLLSDVQLTDDTHVVSMPINSSTSSKCPVAPGVNDDHDHLPEGHPHTQSKSSTRIQSAPKPPTYGIFGQGLQVVNEATSNNIRSIRKLLEDALNAFPNNAFLRVYAAHIVRAAQGNVYLESSHLQKAFELADPIELDVIFFTTFRQTQLNDEKQRVMTGKMTVETRIYFEQQMVVASQKVGQCRLAILSFWNSLCESNPDLIALETKGVAIYAATKESEACFRELLNLVPTSIPVLRAYSEFLLEVTNNPGLAAELMNDADQIEDEASKLQSILKDVDHFEFGSPASFDMSSDGTALMSVSARTDVDQLGGVPSLGIVLFSNLAALRALGYSSAKRELIGKEMSLIIVNPIASIHPQYLSTFVKTGNQRLTGSSRNLFALHRTGYIVPIMGIVQATGDQWLVAFEEVSAPHIAFLWVTDRNTNWKVTAACRRSISLFGITIPSLRSGSVSMTNFYYDMDSLINRVLATPGSIVQLRGLPKKRNQNLEQQDASLDADITSKGASAHFRVFCQELTVPLVASTIYIFKFLAASPADVKAAELAGLIPPLESDEEDSDADSEDTNDVESDDEEDDEEDEDNEDLNSSDHPEDIGSVDAQSAGSHDLPPKNDEKQDDQVDDNRSAAGKLRHAKESKSAAKMMKEMTRVALKPNAIINDNDDHSEREVKKTDESIENNASTQKESTRLPKSQKDHDEGAQKKMKSSLIKSAVKSSTVKSRGGDARVGFAEPQMQPSVVFVEERSGPNILFTEVPSKGPIHFEELRDSPVNDESELSNNPPLPPPVTKFISDQSNFNSPQTVVQKMGWGESKPKKNSARVSMPDPPASPTPNTPTTEKTSKLAQLFKVKPTSKRNIAASVASGDSNNSRTMSTTEQIRAGVALRSRVMEKSLIRLRSSVILVFIIICFTNIASYIVTRILTEHALSNILKLRDLAHVGTYVRNIIKTIQLATLKNDGRYNYDASIAWHREYVRKYVNLAEQLHKSLYLDAESSGDQSDKDIFLSPVYNYSNLVTGTYVSKDEYITSSVNRVSLNDLMISFAARTRSVWFYEFEQYQHNDSNIFWLEHTAGRELADALNETIFHEAAKISDIESVRLGNSVVLGVALTVFFMIATFVIIPATFDVLREQREVFEVFSAVPVKVIRHIRDRLSERISFLIREAAGEEAGEDIDLSAGGFTPSATGDQVISEKDDPFKDDESIGSNNKGLRMRPGGSLALVIAQGVAKDASKIRRENDEDDPKRAAMLRRRDAFYTCFFCFRKPDIEKVLSRRKFSRDSTGVADLLLKMLWPIFIFVAYYIGMYIQRASVADMASTARISVQWTAELEVLVPSVGYAFRNAVIYSDLKFTKLWLHDLEYHVDFLDYVIGAITYGDDKVGLPSLVSTSKGAFQLLMKDACLENILSDEECARFGEPSGCYSSYSMALCKKPYDSIDVNRPVFASGVVGTGLTSAVLFFSRLVNNVLRDRRIEYDTFGFYNETNLNQNTDLTIISEMASKYLTKALSELTNILVEEVKASVNAAMEIDILAVVFSILALIGFYFFLYDPLVGKLDKEIKRTRFLLLLFPEEVAKGVPAVVAAGKKLMKAIP
jgi:hypothetical protein